MAGRRDDERFEIAPRRPRGASDAAQPIARVARSIWHYARQSRFAGKTTPSPSAPALPHLQRCAVRITYASNRVRGQWRAHGRYVAREAATERDSAESRDSPFTEPTRERGPPAGYDRAREGLDLAAELDAWQLALQAAESKKAENVRVLDLQGLTSFTDYLVLCTGNNPRQVQAIADEVEFQLKNFGERPKSVEGYKNAEWVLLDYGDYVVNVFSDKARTYYDLDRLWQDAAEVRQTEEQPS
jgi:ribosome-associated protein